MSIEEIKTIRSRFTDSRHIHRKQGTEVKVVHKPNEVPFYKQLLVDYLGGSYTNQMYDELFDEVARDVDFRFKQLNLQNIIN